MIATECVTYYIFGHVFFNWILFKSILPNTHRFYFLKYFYSITFGRYFGEREREIWMDSNGLIFPSDLGGLPLVMSLMDPF